MQNAQNCEKLCNIAAKYNPKSDINPCPNHDPNPTPDPNSNLNPIAIPAILEKWVPYSQRYLFNAIPDTNHNANPTNPNRYSKGNPNPTNPNTIYRCE